jgi:hypothetical protein
VHVLDLVPADEQIEVHVVLRDAGDALHEWMWQSAPTRWADAWTRTWSLN